MVALDIIDFPQTVFAAMTSIWKRGLGRMRALGAQLLATKTIRMRNQRGIVSFTFDDFPRSAMRGAKILENQGLCGTFYAACSLSERTLDDTRYFGASDILALSSVGHEIGCHTFSHLPVSTLKTRRLREEIDNNAAFVDEKLNGYVLCNFSYPFGDISSRSKFLLQRYFASCRGIRRGLNMHRADLGLLKAIPLYSHSIDEAVISKLVEETAAKAAWLIFYTHDIDDVPSCYGCTPEMFEYAVRLAAAKTEVLTIRSALAAIRYGDHESGHHK